MFYAFRFLLLAAVLTFNLCNAVYTNDQNLAEEKFITSDNAQLFCRVFGQGDPIIVVHGAPGACTQDYLIPEFSRLANNNLVIFYDQRGCGRSTGESEQQMNVQTFVEDIEAIRKSLNLKKITLIGHSWGGYLSMKYAIQYPENVDKMILIGTMPASQDGFMAFLKEVTKRLAPIQDKIQAIEASEDYKLGDAKAVERKSKLVFAPYLYNKKDIDKLDLLLPSQGILSGIKVFEMLCKNVFFTPYNLFEELQNIQCRALILHGDCDPIPYETAEHIQQALPNAKIMKLEHSGHFPHVEQPENLFDSIESFLRS